MSISDPLNQLGSIWYYSKPSDVPYSPNQFLAVDFFSTSYRKTSLLAILNRKDSIFRKLHIALKYYFKYCKCYICFQIVSTLRLTEHIKNKHKENCPYKCELYLIKYNLCVVTSMAGIKFVRAVLHMFVLDVFCQSSMG